MGGHKPTEVCERVGGSSLSDDERAFLCDLLRSALLDIRGFARTRDSARVLAVAEAFQNVPDFISRGGFTWDDFVAEFQSLKETTGMGQYLDDIDDFLSKRRHG